MSDEDRKKDGEFERKSEKRDERKEDKREDRKEREDKPREGEKKAFGFEEPKGEGAGKRDLSPFMKSAARIPSSENATAGTSSAVQQKPEGGEGGVEEIVRNIDRAARSDFHACRSLNDKKEL